MNQHAIKSNTKGENKSVLTVKTYKDNIYTNEVAILDKEGNEVAKVIYSPNKPLSCGARVWIETQNEVKIK